MTEDLISYEMKSVHVVRGLENRTISKWEGEGWEFVSQTPGKLRIELHFRRPKPKSRALLYGVIGGAVAVVLAIVIGIGVATEGSGPESTHTVEASATPPASSQSDTGEPEDDETLAEPTEATVVSNSDALTEDNSEELRELLELTDYCDSAVPEFATEFEDRVISFDASITAMNPHGDATTRYDILINAGDYSETESRGPMFQFRDVNITSDLHFTGEVPDSVGIGTELHVEAQVREYESSSCLLLLDPVETSFR